MDDVGTRIYRFLLHFPQIQKQLAIAVGRRPCEEAWLHCDCTMGLALHIAIIH